MSSKVYYHNLSQGWYNEGDYADAAESSAPDDKIMFSVAGCALLFDMNREDPNLESKGEYTWIREQYKEYFNKFHKE